MQMHLRIFWARSTTGHVVSHTELSGLKFTGLIFLVEKFMTKKGLGK